MACCPGRDQAQSDEQSLGQNDAGDQYGQPDGENQPCAGVAVLARPAGAARPQCAGEPGILTEQPGFYLAEPLVVVSVHGSSLLGTRRTRRWAGVAVSGRGLRPVRVRRIRHSYDHPRRTWRSRALCGCGRRGDGGGAGAVAVIPPSPAQAAGAIGPSTHLRERQTCRHRARRLSPPAYTGFDARPARPARPTGACRSPPPRRGARRVRRPPGRACSRPRSGRRHGRRSAPSRVR